MTDERPSRTVAGEGPTEPASTGGSMVPLATTLPAAGYAMGALIGRGGMGEVLVARDERIGREVAIKRMRVADPGTDLVSRFLREAQIQARLDHPAIVPVHELGVDADGRPYFTMKRVTGETLARRLDARGPIEPLLRAFVEVCQAIEFAHTRGVIHRDLKPANIMLGAYGEVYVLDWGIAGTTAGPAESGAPDRPGRATSHTQTGDLLGTPGYMAPEQVRGERVGIEADVYALGAILFEILAGEPLHPRGEQGLASTLARPQQAPSARTPERAIAPELDVACREALAGDPHDRLTAHELRERIQRYVDGDRDLAQRRELAREHLALAREAFASGDPERRSTAMQRAGRALALDPASEEAAQLVSTLMVEPPAQLPAELDGRIRTEERVVGEARMRIGVLPLLLPLATLVLMPWLHVKSWANVGWSYGCLALAAAVQRFVHVRGQAAVLVSIAMVVALSLAFSRVVGPFILTPIVLTGMFTAMAASRWLDARRPILLAIVALAALAPFACEALGLLATTWVIDVHGVLSMSSLFAVGGQIETWALIASDLLLIAAITIYAANIHRDARAARRRLTIQAWHLHQLLPATGGAQRK